MHISRWLHAFAATALKSGGKVVRRVIIGKGRGRAEVSICCAGRNSTPHLHYYQLLGACIHPSQKMTLGKPVGRMLPLLAQDGARAEERKTHLSEHSLVSLYCGSRDGGVTFVVVADTVGADGASAAPDTPGSGV